MHSPSPIHRSFCPNNIRPFVGERVSHPLQSQEEVTVGTLLSIAYDYVDQEWDNTRDTGVLNRLKIFKDAIPSIAFDGGTQEEQKALKREITTPSCAYDLFLTELENIVTDLERQMRGSSESVGLSGEGLEGLTPPPTPKKLPEEEAPSVEDDENHQSPPDLPSSWRDSLKDSEQNGDVGDWKESLDMPALDTGVGDDWRQSIEGGVSDSEIAASAGNDFDSQTRGDTQGYYVSLRRKHRTGRRILISMKEVRGKYYGSKDSWLV